MAITEDLTTLVCLFHHQDQASAAIKDLHKTGIAEADISNFGGSNSTSSLEDLGVPERDLKHLNEGLRDGGYIVSVTTSGEYVNKVEDIFASHKAKKIDEADRDNSYVAPVATAVSGEAAIPVVEEEMLVGKRAVDQGGVRVYRRVVEIPVEESVDLREEHINIDRRAVDRPVIDADLAFGDRTIELTETAEEAVVGKSARVVEEVLVGKEVSSHTEHIQDSVRHTEVEVEEIVAGETPAALRDR